MSFTHCPACGKPWAKHGTACGFSASVAASTTNPSITAEPMRETMKRLDNQNLAYIRNLIKGVTVLPDELGLMVPENGYAVVVGKKLWARLKEDK